MLSTLAARVRQTSRQDHLHGGEPHVHLHGGGPHAHLHDGGRLKLSTTAHSCESISAEHCPTSQLPRQLLRQTAALPQYCSSPATPPRASRSLPRWRAPGSPSRWGAPDSPTRGGQLSTGTPTLAALGQCTGLGDSTLLHVGGLQALRHEGDLHALLHGSGLQPLSSASLTSVSTTQGAPDAKVTKDHEDKREQERYGGREKEKKKRLRKNTSSSR